MSEKPRKPQILLKDITPVFSNFTQISHRDDEFSFSFIHMFLQHTPVPQGQVTANVTVTPKHAKRILNALQDNIRKYEQKHGKIKLPEEKEEKEIYYRV